MSAALYPALLFTFADALSRKTIIYNYIYRLAKVSIVFLYTTLHALNIVSFVNFSGQIHYIITNTEK